MQTSRLLQASLRSLANKTISITLSKLDKIRTKLNANQWGLGTDVYLKLPLLFITWRSVGHLVSRNCKCSQVCSQQWHIQFEFWLYCAIISLGKGMSQLQLAGKKKKKIINWHTHFISTTRKCSFLAMGRDGSQLVPGHFTALLISCVCSIGRHAYCNCFASCLHTFSRPDSSIACREFNVGKLHHADCRGTQQRCLASSTNIIVLHTDTAFYACIISDTRNSFPTTNSISRILMGCKI